jgi:hypothetical protein
MQTAEGFWPVADMLKEWYVRAHKVGVEDKDIRDKSGRAQAMG